MLATRVAAALKADPGVDVQLRRGGIGELSVSVDGVKAVDTNIFLYPRPQRIARKVREVLLKTSASEPARPVSRRIGN